MFILSQILFLLFLLPCYTPTKVQAEGIQDLLKELFQEQEISTPEPIHLTQTQVEAEAEVQQNLNF